MGLNLMFHVFCLLSGLVRYWPNIAHKSSSFEVTADLQGQECILLKDIQPVGSILGTTTSTLAMALSPTN